MSVPSALIWNWRSGFGICFTQTMMFKATMGVGKIGRYFNVAQGDKGRGVTNGALLPNSQAGSRFMGVAGVV